MEPIKDALRNPDNFKMSFREPRNSKIPSCIVENESAEQPQKEKGMPSNCDAYFSVAPHREKADTFLCSSHGLFFSGK